MPRGRPPGYTITLTRTEYLGLQRLSLSPEVTRGLARRARLILLVASGQTLTTAAAYAFMSRQHADKWVKRWLKEGIVGLFDRERGGLRERRREEETA